MDACRALAGTSGGWSGHPAEASEMDRAQRVQQQLCPRNEPRLETLDLAGGTLPGRAVGGDFYDFLRPSPDRLALILGDVSGHGVPAALMMAALQASLRTHYAVTAYDLGSRVESLNGLFFDCTAAEHYAGLFLGEYDDASRDLLYANCGHVPPLLVRAEGEVERLEPTGTVLGMFETWQGRVERTRLLPGDTLVLVTDGILEASDRARSEFGDLRLLSSILRHRDLEPAALIRAIARDLRMACSRRPSDDATIVVARARGGRARGDG